MSDPLVPNFKPPVGRLVTDRFDFENHIKGNNFKHTADKIDLFPTLVVGSTTTTNVQNALQAIINVISEPNDATTSSKGIVQLSGDIAGTATSIIVTGIQGKPISNLTPSMGDVLTWNAGTSVWNPAPGNSFAASGDLSGDNVSQQVNGLTGIVSNVTVGKVITASNTIISYITTVNPLYTQSTFTSSDAHSMTIRAQSTTAGNRKGGDLILASGAPGASGRKGSVKLQFTSSVNAGYPITSVVASSTNMVQLSEPQAGRKILSLCHPTDLSTIDMPSDSGDMVIYVRDAATIPGAGNPSNGTILYSDSGQLWVKQEDGNNFPIGSLTNPSIWGDLGQQTYTYRNYLISNPGGPATAYSFSFPDLTTMNIDVIFVGKQAGTTNAGHFNLKMGYVKHTASTPNTVGTVTSVDPRNHGSGSDWTIPNINLSGNTVQILTGFSSGVSIQWLVITKLTIVKTAS